MWSLECRKSMTELNKLMGHTDKVVRFVFGKLSHFIMAKTRRKVKTR